MKDKDVNTTMSTVKSTIGKKMSIVFISIFISILALPTLLWGVLLCLNTVNPSIMENINFDTGENRNMAEFPDEFDINKFPSDFEKWYNDNVPFRSFFYDLNNKIEKAFEKTYVNNIKPFLTTIFHPITSNDLNDKFNEGYESGKNDGYESGKNDGYESGKNDGYNDGYQQGYEDGSGGTIGSSCSHTFGAGKIVEYPTCTEEGMFERTCTKCHYTQQYSIEANGHVLEYISTVEMTCVTDHKHIHYCSVCDNFVEEIIEKAHHTQGEKIKTVLPSFEDYGYDLYKCSCCQGEYRVNILPKLQDLSYMAPYYLGNNKSVLQGRNDWLFYAGEGNLRWYVGNDFISDEIFQEWLDILLKLDSYCEENGKEFALLVGPNKEHIYSEHLPSLEIVDEYKEMQRFFDFVTENSDIKFIYPKDEMLEAKKYHQLYLKYDTHWSNAGGYVAVSELYKALGLPSISINNLPVIEREHVKTDRHYKDLIPMIGMNQEDFYDVNYDIDYEGFKSYGYDDYSDYKFLLLGDSYRLIPSMYIGKDFDFKVYHYRNYENVENVPTGVQAIKDTDYLVVSCNERAISLLIKNLQALIEGLGL